jgi:hypothetical protein
MKGHYAFPPFQRPRPKYNAGSCSGPVNCNHSLPEAFETIVPLFKPSVLILNCGLWKSTNQWDDSFIERVFSSGSALNNTQKIWKTTTSLVNGIVTDVKVLALAAKSL